MPEKAFNIKKYRKLTVYCLIIFFILITLFLSVVLIIQLRTNKIRKIEIENNEKRIVALEKEIMGANVDSLITDLMFLSDIFHTFDKTGNYGMIEKQWRDFSERKKSYDKIRYIDVTGKEQIRVNYSETGPVLVDREHLQIKWDRYFFQDSLNLKQGQIYISKLDLNVEDGKIEQPPKPTIRFSVGVYDDAGKLKGIVITNYYAQYLLNVFESISSTSLGDIYLLNSDGYWISDQMNRDREWAFLYEDRKDLSFRNSSPEGWNKINGTLEGTVTTKKEFLTYARITPDIRSDYSLVSRDNWFVVSSIPVTAGNRALFFPDFAKSFLLALNHNLVYFPIFLIMAIALTVVMHLYIESKEKIKYYSIDALTGVYSRRSGLELLQRTYFENLKYGRKACICYFDIDCLKQVNDACGHETGDELISVVVETVKKFTRFSDFIARLGGDEFIIVFVDASTEQAEEIWKRISNEFRQINESGERKYRIGVSHGIEEFSFSSGESIDEVISMADRKMYEEKKKVKRRAEQT